MARISISRLPLLQIFSLIALAALSTGCCVNPLYDDWGEVHNFYGATLTPNERVLIQARPCPRYPVGPNAAHPRCSVEWETIAEARTRNAPEIGWGGIAYYPWVRVGLRVPDRFWTSNHGYPVGHKMCQVRIVDLDGNTLHTYYDWDIGDMFFANPIDVWRARGNRHDNLRLWKR